MPEKDVSTPKGYHHHGLLNATTNTVNNRLNDTCNKYGTSGFGEKATDSYKTVTNNVFYDKEMNNSGIRETVVSDKVRYVADGEFNQNRYGYGYHNNNGNKAIGSNAYNRAYNNNVRNTDRSMIVDTDANYNLENEALTSTERSKVNYYNSESPKKTVSNNRNLNNNKSSVTNNVNESTNVGTKFDFKIPKIIRKTSSAVGDQDSIPSISNKNNSQWQQQNYMFSKRSTIPSLDVKKIDSDQTSKTYINKDDTKKISKSSPVLEQNCALRTNNKLLTKDGREAKREIELSIKKLGSDAIQKSSPKTDIAEGSNVMPVPEINNKSKGNKMSIKDTILSNRGHESSNVNETVIMNIEKNKSSPATGENDNCRPCKLSPKEIVLNNRSHESLNVKDTVCDRSLQVDANSNKVETKFSQTVIKNNVCSSNKSLKEIVLNNRGNGSSCIKETVCDRTLHINTGNRNDEETQFSSLSDKTKKYTSSELSTKEVALNKRYPELLDTKVTESSRILKKDPNTSNIKITTFSQLVEKNDEFVSNEESRKKIVLNKSNQLSVGDVTDCNVNRIKMIDKVGQEHITEEGINPLLTEQKTGALENPRKKLLRRSNLELKIRRDSSDSSERTQFCGGVERKSPSKVSVVRENKFRSVSSEQINRTQEGNVGPEIVAETSQKTGVHGNTKKMLLLRDNMETKIKSDSCDSSQRSQHCDNFKRRVPDKISVVPEKIFRNVSSEHSIRTQEYSISPETDAETSQKTGVNENIKNRLLLKGNTDLKINSDSCDSSERSQHYESAKRRLPDIAVPAKKFRSVSSVRIQECSLSPETTAATSQNKENTTAGHSKQTAIGPKIFFRSETLTNVSISVVHSIITVMVSISIITL